MGFELPNPFRTDSRPVSPPPSVSNREWTRLYVMGFVLFLVVACMVYMKKMSDTLSKPKERPGPGQVEYKIQDTTKGPQDAADPKEGPEAPKKVIEVPASPGEEGVDFRRLAAPFRDGMDRIVKETPEFITLVSVFLKSVTAAGMAGKVVPGLTADRAYLEPEKNRGAALRVYGRMIQIYTERIDATTPDNVEFVYLGVMQEYPTNRTVIFYMPEKPMDPATGKPVEFGSYRKRGDEFVTDWVEIEGIFLRQFVYPSQMEDGKGQTLYAKASAMFVKNLKLSAKPQFSDPRGSFIFIVGGLAVVVAVIVVVAGIMTRKYGAGSIREKLAQVRKQKEGAPHPPAAPEGGTAAIAPVPPPAPAAVEPPKDPAPPAPPPEPPPNPPQAG